MCKLPFVQISTFLQFFLHFVVPFWRNNTFSSCCSFPMEQHLFHFFVPFRRNKISAFFLFLYEAIALSFSIVPLWRNNTFVFCCSFLKEQHFFFFCFSFPKEQHILFSVVPFRRNNTCVSTIPFLKRQNFRIVLLALVFFAAVLLSA